MKRLCILFLAICMSAGMVPSEVFAADTVSSPYAVGDIIEFGSYPQNQVTDESLISELNSLELDWQSYGYYSGDGSPGSMTQSDYMQYADVAFNGSKYRAVRFSAYRPAATIKRHYESETYQDDNGFHVDTVYWFEYASLSWRILGAESGLVLCEDVIDAQAYCDTVYGSRTNPFYNNPEQTVFINDYATSSIREWLNGTFFAWAFTEEERSNIKQTELTNKAYSSTYDSMNTVDKIFLLSTEDTDNADYCFETFSGLKATGTDYAEIQGVKYGYWWTRTAGKSPHDAIRIDSNGYGVFDTTFATSNGIRPAMCIDLDSLEGKTCRLDELTSVDYLAFSDLAYSSIDESEIGAITVGDIIGESRWGNTWKNTDIKNSELFAHIENWVVYDFEENEKSGFAAYAFKNDYNEFLIAYRGSTELSLPNLLNPDWLENDIAMIFGGNGNQVYEAILFAEQIIEMYGSDAVAVTGHSLGGALCDIVSARFSCYAESFNAAPFLANAYYYYPDVMGEMFSGTEKWLFVDHVTDGDFVGTLSPWMKNYVIHKYNQYEGGEHSLASLITRDGFGNLYLTAVLKTAETMSTIFLTPIYLGTASADIFSVPDTGLSHTVYAGDDSDNISTGKQDDVLLGGKGEDLLDGGHGDDDYFYYKGDGEDWIFDISGKDTLYMMGFCDADILTLEVGDAFVNILCNGDEIIHIAKDRVNNFLNSNKFTMITHYETDPTSTDITTFLSPRVYKGRMTIACPVYVEIINDSTGEIVYTLLDGEFGVGSHHTEYGYFYVYQDDNGDYVKTADLFEGYSVRIVGTADGTMAVSAYEVCDEGLSDALSAENIPVTSNLVVTVEESDGDTYLLMDTDGDGSTDQTVQLTGTNPIPTLGDVNGDGSLSAKDATLILRYAVKKYTDYPEWFEKVADVNGDGEVNAKDATMILRYAVGKTDIPGWE